MIHLSDGDTRKGKSAKMLAQEVIFTYFCASKKNLKQYGGLSLVNTHGCERKVRATQSITFLNEKLRVTAGLR